MACVYAFYLATKEFLILFPLSGIPRVPWRSYFKLMPTLQARPNTVVLTWLNTRYWKNKQDGALKEKKKHYKKKEYYWRPVIIPCSTLIWGNGFLSVSSLTHLFLFNHFTSTKTNCAVWPWRTPHSTACVMSMQLLCNTANQPCLWSSVNK